ncbi:hypothetical protein VPNG_03390 [Cytospora leucostoma]|uniref:HRDC domain-containing protein n=1 Tax=Cytospora leucostoma TaxID=1230097 RepID=A0A423XFT7_9PEZI|nr:hypothetical protein VPNG_03390 [Cytospora leucostoma]
MSVPVWAQNPRNLVASSLRKVVESPSITKAGVNILTADFKRLREHFGPNPQGAVELSRLHDMQVAQEAEGLPRDNSKSGRCGPFRITHNSVLEAIVRDMPQTKAEFLKIKEFGKKRADTLGAALLDIIIDQQAEEISKGRSRSPSTGGQIANAEMPDNLTDDSDGSGIDEAVEHVTPNTRPPQLHTCLTPNVQKIDLSSQGTRSKPIEPDDSDEEDHNLRESPLARRVTSANAGSQLDGDHCLQRHSIMQYFPTQRGSG